MNFVKDEIVITTLNKKVVVANFIQIDNKDKKYALLKDKNTGRNFYKQLVDIEHYKDYKKNNFVNEDIENIVKNGQNEKNINGLTEVVEIDINKKFNYLSKLIRMVLDKIQPSIIVAGEPGLGKTWEVYQSIEKFKIKKDLSDFDFVTVKGTSTAKGLYRILYENQDKVIVFDDCDEIIKNEISCNILKSALDNYNVRTISWLTGPTGDMPSSFEFKGSIIFITNLEGKKLPKALVSRSFCIDLTMTLEDKMKRMQEILPKLLEDRVTITRLKEDGSKYNEIEKERIILQLKKESLEYLNSVRFRCNDFNIRTLVKIIKIRFDSFNNYEDEEEWKHLANFTTITQ